MWGERESNVEVGRVCARRVPGAQTPQLLLTPQQYKNASRIAIKPNRLPHQEPASVHTVDDGRKPVVPIQRIHASKFRCPNGRESRIRKCATHRKTSKRKYCVRPMSYRLGERGLCDDFSRKSISRITFSAAALEATRFLRNCSGSTGTVLR